MQGRIDHATVARCSSELEAAAASPMGAQVAICYQLPAGRDGLHEGLAAQRALTNALREAQGDRAESVPVFVVSDRDGERLDDCATAWGATEVKR